MSVNFSQNKLLILGFVLAGTGFGLGIAGEKSLGITLFVGGWTCAAIGVLGSQWRLAEASRLLGLKLTGFGFFISALAGLFSFGRESDTAVSSFFVLGLLVFLLGIVVMWWELASKGTRGRLKAKRQNGGDDE